MNRMPTRSARRHEKTDDDDDDDPMMLAFAEWAEEAENPTLREAFEAGYLAALGDEDEDDE